MLVAACRRCLYLLLLLAAGSVLSGCYYLQAIRGQLDVMAHRRPIDEVLADPDTPPELARRLRLLRDARQFASDELLLPDNGSYRSYADLDRDHVVWNVMAAPEFSLAPKTWCYPFVGCVAYRGYFAETAANRQAERLRSDGFDVYVGGVAAYSTLGRFNDPLLNTMLVQSNEELVTLLFHELAHQKLYIRDDTEFNESFASAVAEIGLERWRQAHGEAPDRERFSREQARQAQIHRLFEQAQDELRTLYASTLPVGQMRQQKAERIDKLITDVRAAAGVTDDSWPAGPVNNARLALMTLYEGRVAAFLGLLDRCTDDLACFYADAETLADKPAAARDDELASLAARYRDRPD